MGGNGHSLVLEPRPGTEVGDLDELHLAISEAVWDVVGRYTNSEACTAIYDRYVEGAISDEGYRTRRGMELSFVFMDFSGCCNRSCELAYHWFGLGIAVASERIDELCSDFGVAVSGDRPTVSEILGAETRVRFINTRDQLYMVYGDLESYDISGDGEVLEPTDAERERAEAMIRAGDTDDPMTRMLAPHPEFASAMRDSLDGADSRIVSSVLWYLGNVGTPDRETVAAMFASAGSSDSDIAVAARRAIARLARHAEIAGAVRERLRDRDPGVRAAALGAIPALRQRQDLEITEAIDALLDGLEAPSPAVDVAAENLGYVDLEGYRNRVIRSLLQLLEGGCPPEAAHGAVLSLINVHIKKRGASDEVKVALAREAESGAAHAGLAQWALGLF